MENPRVLLVDDEPDLLSVCARALRRAGLAVTTATNAAEARSYLENEPFDLLITDIRMPEEDGVSLLHTVHELTPTLPMMIITGYPDTDSVDAALELNVRSYLLKPFDIEQFVAEVRRSLGITPPPQEEQIREWIERANDLGIPALSGTFYLDNDGRLRCIDENGQEVDVLEWLREIGPDRIIALLAVPQQS